MIIFYDKNNGEIFHVIDGRVHNEKEIKINISSPGRDNIGKLIIGWEETNKVYTEIEEQEKLVESIVYDKNRNKLKAFIPKKVKVKVEKRKMIEHNMDKFEILQKIEDRTPVNAFNYKVDINNGNLILK